MTRTRERGGVKGKFSRGNYRKHLEEFRVSFKFTTGSVRHTPPQSTESRNLRKLSNGGTVLEIRSPKKSSALCALVDSVSFPSNGPPPLSPSGRHSSLLHFFSVCSTWDCLQIANPSKVGFARKKKNSVQFTQPPLCEENKEGLLLCHAATGALKLPPSMLQAERDYCAKSHGTGELSHSCKMLLKFWP